MKSPAHPPKKPANQGGKAAANVQPVNHQEKAASNTNGLPHQYGPTHGAWANHVAAKNHGGTRGSGKGAK